MNILAINFGHDASLALFRNGQLQAFSELERLTRRKHSVGITVADVTGFLFKNDCDYRSIDAIGLCGTQWWNAKHESGLSLTPGFNNAVFGSIENQPEWSASPSCMGTDKWYCYESHASRLSDVHQTSFPMALSGALQHHKGLPDSPQALDNLVATTAHWLSIDRAEDSIRRRKTAAAMQPYVMMLENIAKPAFFIPHQLAHATYGAYYLPSGASGFILCHDGGWPHIPLNSGGIYLAGKHGVYPLLDPQLFVGQLYQRLGEIAGFGAAEAPGKLMGLAAYGFPDPRCEKVVDRLLALAAPSNEWRVETFEQSLLDTLDTIAQFAKGSPVLRLAAREHSFAFPSPEFSIALAANAQYIVESVWERAISTPLSYLLDRFDLSREVPMVGGFALNCPANTRLQMAIPGSRIRPLPGAGDMGTAIGAGAAVSAYLGDKLPRAPEDSSAAFPPRPPLAREKTTISGALEKIPTPTDLSSWYATELVAGKIFCHVEGDAEVGPRALGHRSIIAHGVLAETRDKINRHKGREAWRPLAPLVRRCDFDRFFFGQSDAADYMLFTFPVIHDELPAITHVDGSARAQSINEGLLFDVLTAIDAQGSHPVIINTSFNVAGEPIVETDEEAVRSFLALGFDYLFLNGQIFQPAGSR